MGNFDLATVYGIYFLLSSYLLCVSAVSSPAVVTPVKYERDIIQVSSILIFLNIGKLTKQRNCLSKPNPGQPWKLGFGMTVQSTIKYVYINNYRLYKINFRANQTKSGRRGSFLLIRAPLS